MKRKLVALFLSLSICLSFVGCGADEEYLESRITELETEITQLETQRDTLKNEVTDIKVENGTAKYVVTFNIKQSHFTLDIGQHIKDEMNEISIQIPVDKEYYDSVEVGNVIDDSFRVGSLLMKGSFGNWEVTVEDKEIQ